MIFSRLVSKLALFVFLRSRDYRHLRENFKARRDPSVSFTRLEEAFKKFDGETQRVLKENLNRHSWPFILTEHGFHMSMSSFGASQVWKKVAEVVEVFSRNGYQTFVTNGTLLGLIREGGFLRFDDDIDLAVYFPGAEAREMAKRIADLPVTFPNLSWSEHHKHKTFHQAVTLEDGPTLDVFPVWRVSETTVVAYPGAPLVKTDLFPTNSYHVEGQNIPIPAQPERVLGNLYGPFWKKEDLSFRFDWSKGAPHFADYRVFCLEHRDIHP